MGHAAGDHRAHAGTPNPVNRNAEFLAGPYHPDVCESTRSSSTQDQGHVAAREQSAPSLPVGRRVQAHVIVTANRTGSEPRGGAAIGRPVLEQDKITYRTGHRLAEPFPLGFDRPGLWIAPGLSDDEYQVGVPEAQTCPGGEVEVGLQHQSVEGGFLFVQPPSQPQFFRGHGLTAGFGGTGSMVRQAPAVQDGMGTGAFSQGVGQSPAIVLERRFRIGWNDRDTVRLHQPKPRFRDRPHSHRNKTHQLDHHLRVRVDQPAKKVPGNDQQFAIPDRDNARSAAFFSQ